MRERDQNFQRFSSRTSIFPGGLKRGKESKIFKKFLAEHILSICFPLTPFVSTFKIAITKCVHSDKS